jgi:hypothetical protein
VGVARIVTAAAVQPTQSAWANGMRQTDNTAVRQLLRAGGGSVGGLARGVRRARIGDGTPEFLSAVAGAYATT